MLRTHARKTVLTTVALVATTAMMTACQDSSSDSDSKKSKGSSSSEQETGGGDSASDNDGTQANSAEKPGKKGGKGVSGTWFGTVSYLAPGKYTVTDMKDQKQQFFTSTTTNIQGAGDICGDENGQAATKCTEAQLEAAAKKGVSAKVQIKNGTAVSIIDDRSGGGDNSGGDKGVSGTWFGTVSYLAPGKYTVSDMKGKEQAFFTSTTTNIQGAGEICGDENGQAATKCSETELEAAAKKGVSAKVQIKDGTAVSVIEDR
ncbi:hypothetical protein DVA86_27425 [Streptomyces armeniacus]|uniref:Lipoprotein n=1 Tax=Streptomyces armeniacus TaxID=83291 RepID=A0A345XVZ0_9ACTN|nr:hypothetical protein [Streptomyces armeniacus]AXK35806.1 hypothetical protein DVA86_27425 [Streptomyces armeniacus]